MSASLTAIALGGNLGDPIAAFAHAVRHMIALPETHLIAHSSFYRSASLRPHQADYTNAAITMSTAVPAMQLLQSLQAIEDGLGRRREGEPWGPRLIDLDIISYGRSVINEPTLTIPHQQAYRRCFVLAPLAEIHPELVLPGYGRVIDLLASCDSGPVTLIKSPPLLAGQDQPAVAGNQHASTVSQADTAADKNH